MSVVARELEKIRREAESKGKNELKQNIFKKLVKSIKEYQSEAVIDALFEVGDFTDEEKKSAYREAGKPYPTQK
ncbi:hypothetical protein LC087_12035 [Bacillus carboniphilus]|uniref:Uncharacterized protein n=1 Tax=Bacillus carboniphilus TaxID=86663 RepID=A0ABY9JQK5_9BACI|nr:hypothetical protein [Bacillus carboniphilus]WLR41607.1 hypothetical protein LC087_12035 [Bacillus carboniphilus]